MRKMKRTLFLGEGVEISMTTHTGEAVVVHTRRIPLQEFHCRVEKKTGAMVVGPFRTAKGRLEWLRLVPPEKKVAEKDE